MTKNEFIWKIEHGDDIMFDVLGRHFTIFTWPDDGVMIVEQNKGKPVKFPSIGRMLAEYEVDGKALADLAGIINISSYTQVSE